MRDGITEIGAMIVAAIVLIMAPIGLNVAKTRIESRSEIERMIYRVVEEANRDEELTEAEFLHILELAAFEKDPLHLVYIGLESVNKGEYGDFIYRANEEQLFEIFKGQNSIYLPEGGLISAYR